MISSNSKLILSLCLVLLNWACASGYRDSAAIALANKPEWLGEKSHQYPDHLFIRGIGVHEDLALAKQRATDALVKVFEKEATLSFSDANNPKVMTNESKLRQYFLEHHQIAEIWQNPISRVFTVLNIIDRVAAGAAFEEGVYRIDADVAHSLEKAEYEQDALQKIAFIQQAIAKQSQREGFVTLINVIKPTTAVSSSAWNQRQIEARLSALIRQVKIKPVAVNNDMHLLKALTAGVGGAGFIVDHGLQADYILKASFQQQHLKWEGGVYRLQGDLHLELVDGNASDRVRGSASWPILVSATERELLTEHVNEAVKNINKEKFRAAFFGVENR